MIADTLKLTESAKSYIKALKDTLKRKYQLSDSKASNLVMTSYIIDSLVYYPEETLHDDIETTTDFIYEDYIRDGGAL
jgi:hypothetical protein